MMQWRYFDWTSWEFTDNASDADRLINLTIFIAQLKTRQLRKFEKFMQKVLRFFGKLILRGVKLIDFEKKIQNAFLNFKNKVLEK